MPYQDDTPTPRELPVLLDPAEQFRLTGIEAALPWLGEGLASALPRPMPGDVLLGLVNLVRRQSPFLNACGVEWVGSIPRGSASFRTARGDVRLISNAAPNDVSVSGTLLAECAETGLPRWVGTDDAMPEGKRSLAGVSAAGCVPVGSRAALYVSSSMPGVLDPHLRLRIELIARLCGALLDAPTSSLRPAEALQGLVGDSPKMQDLARTVRAFAEVPWPVLILGETGTGKEAVARALHDLSDRPGRFIAVNCAAIAEGVAESELFGHTKGAYTHAVADHDGFAREAKDGTLFLDEVGELPVSLQAKLLRLLQEQTYRPVGAKADLNFRGRVVAATHRPIDDAKGVGATFRRDLFQRLGACVIRVPSLRERRDDIPSLAAYLLQRAISELPPGVSIQLSEDALAVLRGREWPGNVRELDNTLKRAVIEARIRKDQLIRARDVMPSDTEEVAVGDDLDAAMESFRRKHVLDVLEATGNNKSRAAERLKISRQALHDMLRRWAMDT